MVKYREALRLHAMGVSIRNIAFSCRCSTATVRAVAGRAKAAGIEWPLPEEMGDHAIREVIYPPKSKADPDKAPIDHDHVDAEMSRPGVTMTLLWSEYCESAVSQGRSPYMYSALCERRRKWAMSRKTAMRIARKPAEQMQVDYVGDTMEVVDMDTGEVLKVYVFAACLPFSGRLCAKGSYDMREEFWVDAHVSAFSFFGGTTPILVPDNLKQGVAKHTVDELVINEQHRRMAEYYGCAVVPGRPRRPRDKAAVEMGGPGHRAAGDRPSPQPRLRIPRCAQRSAPGQRRPDQRGPSRSARAAGTRYSSAKRKHCSSRCRANPTRRSRARPPPSILTTMSPSTEDGAPPRSPMCAARWRSAPPRARCGSSATGSASPSARGCTGRGGPIPRTPTTCPTPTATSPSGTGSLPQMGKGSRPRLRRRHRGDPLVEGGRAAVLQILQGGDGAGRQARRARARAGLRQGALLLSQAELQDHQVDHRQKRRAVRGGPGCRRVPARKRLLQQP